MLQAGRSPVRVLDEVDFFNLSNPSSRTMALVLTQPLREMSTRSFPGGKKQPARRADNLATICEPNVCKLWEPQPLTTLRATTACTGIALPLPMPALMCVSTNFASPTYKNTEHHTQKKREHKIYNVHICRVFPANPANPTVRRICKW
jgi:hypothetical protein